MYLYYFSEYHYITIIGLMLYMSLKVGASSHVWFSFMRISNQLAIQLIKSEHQLAVLQF